MNQFPELRTDRLLLRQPADKDCATIFFLRSDPGVMRFIKREPAKSLKDAEDFLLRITQGYHNSQNINWCITLKGQEKMLGSVCLWNFSADRRRGELGYDLHPDFHKKGIMAEAVRAVLEHGFSVLRLQEIEAFTHKNNESSKKMLMRNGFVPDAGRRDEDNPDNVIFVLRAEKFRAGTSH